MKLFLALVFASILALFLRTTHWIGGTRIQAVNNQRMLDFNMRVNEVSCVLNGVDPYLVWKGDAHFGSYVPWNFQEAVYESEKIVEREYVHAYPPWTYPLMMPFALVSRWVAGSAYLVLNYALLAAMTIVALFSGWRVGRGVLWPGLFVAAAFWTAFCQIPACLHYGNYGVLVLAAIGTSVFCHLRRADCLAGVFWALAFLKPQIAAIFLIPLFFLRKWKTFAVLAGTLTGLSVIPALLCHRSVLEMILCIGDYSRNQFIETGFIPQSVFLDIVGTTSVPPNFLTFVSAAAGGVICLFLTGMLVWTHRKLQCTRDLILIFLPAFVLSTIWTASRIHDLSIHAATAAFLAYLALTAKSRRDSLWPVALMLLLMGFPWDAMLNFRVNVFQMTALAVLCLGVLRSCRESVDPVEEVVSCR